MEHPRGIPGPSELGAIKVKKANLIYEFIAKVIDLCCVMGILLTIEIPKNSLFFVSRHHGNDKEFDLAVQHPE